MLQANKEVRMLLPLSRQQLKSLGELKDTELYVQKEGRKMDSNIQTCNACHGEFDLEGEGGIAGDFGILPMAFCPTCYASMVDMVHQIYPCPHCEKFYEEEDEGDDEDA